MKAVGILISIAGHMIALPLLLLVAAVVVLVVLSVLKVLLR